MQFLLINTQKLECDVTVASSCLLAKAKSLEQPGLNDHISALDNALVYHLSAFCMIELGSLR